MPRSTHAPLLPGNPSVRTTIGGYVLAVARALEHSGIDSTRVLQVAGISPSLLKNDPMSRLPIATMTRLYKVCVDATHDPYFGLTVARYVQFSNFHALGHALAASSSLMEFCRRLARFFRLASDAAEINVVESGNEVSLRAKLLVTLSAEAEDAAMGFVVLTMRQLYKSDFSPLRVELSHPMPCDGGEPYEAFFRAPVRFGQPAPMLVLSGTDLQQPLAGACAELAQLNDNLATSYIVRLDKNDIATAVRQKIIEYLPDGDCTRDRVARAICTNANTLRFKLSQCETSFQELLDSTRKELASSYLQQSAEPSNIQHTD